MSIFWKFSGLLALALAVPFTVCAETNDVAKFSGVGVDVQCNPVAGAKVDCYQQAIRMGAAESDLEAKQHAVTDSQGAFQFSTFQGEGL